LKDTIDIDKDHVLEVEDYKVIINPKLVAETEVGSHTFRITITTGEGIRLGVQPLFSRPQSHD